VITWTHISLTPCSVLTTLWQECTDTILFHRNEASASDIARILSHIVRYIFSVLREDVLDFTPQVWTNLRHTGTYRDPEVITNHVYAVNGHPKNLWEDKLSKAFNFFIGQLLDMINSSNSKSGLGISPRGMRNYEGYNAILSKVCTLCFYHSSVHLSISSYQQSIISLEILGSSFLKKRWFLEHLELI